MMCDSSRLAGTKGELQNEISDDKIVIVTEPETDLWQRTYATFRADNASALQMKTDAMNFSFTAKASFDSDFGFDQCGVIIYIDEDTWLKASMECEDETLKHLGSVVTNHGYSDWAATDVPADTKDMWYRIYRKGSDFQVQCSFDGVHYSMLRMAHLWKTEGEIGVGVYACSPAKSSFKAEFTELDFKELSESELPD